MFISRIRTPHRVEACDRRRTAIHEAGHLVVAWHFGVPAHANIWRQDNPTSDMSQWVGQTQILSYEVRRDRLGRLRPRRVRVSPATWRKIGVAGIVAEAAWEGEDRLLNVEDLFIDPHSMSATDWKAAGGSPDELVDSRIIRAAEDVAGLLAPNGPLRGDLVRVARELITYGEGVLEPRETSIAGT